MEDDKPLDLRDKFALDILNGILSNDKISNWSTIFNGDYYTHTLNDEQLMELVRTAYKISDMMRKVRIGSFE
jgi:hypothetical protein